MNQKIKLNQGIKYVIIGFFLFLFLMIWPLGIVQNSRISKSKEIQIEESGPINVENNATQLFLAEGKELKAIALYVLNDMQSQTITLRIYDSAKKQLWETFYVVKKGSRFPGFLQIPVGIALEEGRLYFYSVEGITGDLNVALEDTYTSDSFSNGTFLYAGEEVAGQNIISRYIYKEPFTSWMILGIGCLLLIVTTVFCFLADQLLLKRLKHVNREVTVQKLVQWIGNPILTIGLIGALWSVFPGRVFGRGILNYGFYYLGILLTATVLFFGINYRRNHNGSFVIIKKEVLSEKLPQWLMAVCFAKVLWSCYEYINGLYTVHHIWATCKILTWLGLTFLCTMKKEEWLRFWNLAYLLPAAMVAYVRYKPFVGLDTEEAITGRLQVRFVYVAGFVALQVLISLLLLLEKKRKVNGSINLVSGGLLLVFMTLMIVYRNTRTWPIVTAVMFGVFYYRMWLWEKRSYLMQIFCNGILLNFIYMVYYCLMHRPYLRFRHNRFGMGFHTVTMTGYYLALVLCAVMIKLFAKYYETNQWQECWKELSLLGIGNVYLFLTLSRTGYLAAFAMEIFICVFFVILKEKKKLWGMIKKIGMGIGVSVLFFPIVFTAQRILPAIANDPIYSEVEIWDYVVEKGDPKDSELYIDITAFKKVAGNKLFGIDMGNISLTRLKPVYITKDSLLVASEAESMEGMQDVSNGRFAIFREYVKEWNFTGHEKMSFPFPDGTTPAHAHNSFLQVIHDHGLITGILFVIFGIFSFCFSIWKCCEKKHKEEFYNALSIAVLLAFGVAGMVEWIFHFANPLGFSLFIVVIPLLFQEKDGSKGKKKSK